MIVCGVRNPEMIVAVEENLQKMLYDTLFRLLLPIRDTPLSRNLPFPLNQGPL